MRVLLTGGDGYVGCLMGPRLVQAGHDVVVVDTGFYRSAWLFNNDDSRPPSVTKDIRRLTVDDLRGFDAVVHLAELSNDPIGALNPSITYQINHQGSVHLAQLAKQAGVERFVYMSSCSVYGVAEDDEVDETSAVNPQTDYARCKLLVERDVAPLADDGFSPTFLRSATAYGASPRQRFDIVINNLSGVAYTTGRLVVESDGTPWRPFVHILDMAKAVATVLAAPRDVAHGQIVNLGSPNQNYQVKEIVEALATVFPEAKVAYGDGGADNRSYRVDFSKLGRMFPTLELDWDIDKGARQLRRVFDGIGLTEELFFSPHYTRLKRLRHLLDTGQLDENFFWRPLS